MNITFKNAKKAPKKFLQGGMVEAPAEQVEEPVAAEAPAELTQEDPMVQLAQIFAQGLQNQDCQMLAQGAQMFLQLIQQAQGMAEEQAAQGEPVFAKNGAKLLYRIKK